MNDLRDLCDSPCLNSECRVPNLTYALFATDVASYGLNVALFFLDWNASFSRRRRRRRRDRAARGRRLRRLYDIAWRPEIACGIPFPQSRPR